MNKCVLLILITLFSWGSASVWAHPESGNVTRSGWSIDTHSPNMIVGSASCSSGLCFVPIVLAEPERISFVLKLEVPDKYTRDKSLLSLKDHYAFLDIFKVDGKNVRFTKITTRDGVSFLEPTTDSGNYVIINKLLTQPTITFYQITSLTSWKINNEGFASQYKLLTAFRELYNSAI
ncbi:hypothetical protein [Photobacterium sanguinicancri]|uniref:hypothetical protein n=1 Tax=Photobacterium sanguinicancri TaxID=875932 RepID=UPI002480D59F|nr:hypothetical protein [Photobacterium sanguinicancri]